MVRLEIKVPKGWFLVADKKDVRKTMRDAGNEVASRARALIRAKAAKGKVRTSIPGEPPVSRAGALAKSIKVKMWRSGEGATIKDVAHYALFLEAGSKGGGGATGKGNTHLAKTGSGKRRQNRSARSSTRVQLPRPFLSRALQEVSNNQFAERVTNSLVKGIKFQKGAGSRGVYSGKVVP